MTKIIKFLLIGVALALLLVVVAGVIFAVTFDPNDYKNQITKIVKDKTGRDLNIEGDLELSFFPRLGFKMGPTTLSDAPGYGEEPFFRMTGAAVGVQVKPLLGRRIEVGKVSLDGFALKLVKGANGRNNWDDFMQLGGDGPAPEDGAPAGGTQGFDLGEVSGVELTDAALTYIDKAAKSEYRISEWDLSTGSVSIGNPIDFSTNLKLAARNPDIDGAVEGSGVADIDPNTGNYALAKPSLKVSLNGNDLPVSPLVIDVSGESLALRGQDAEVVAPKINISGTGGGDPLSSLDIDIESPRITLQNFDTFALERPAIAFDLAGAGIPGNQTLMTLTASEFTGSLKQETLKLRELVANAYDLKLNGGVSGRDILSGYRFTGQIRVAEFSPKELMQRMGAEAYVTADPSALQRVSLSANYGISATKVNLTRLQMKLDDTAMNGTLSVADFDSPKVRFALDADKLALDRYMAPASDAGAQAEAGDEVAIPADELKGLNVKGTLKIGEASFGGLRSSDVDIGVLVNNDAMRIHPARANLYGGTYQGDIRLNASGAQPIVAINERLAGVDFGALSQDMYGTARMSGTLNGNIKARGEGRTVSALQQTLSGDAAFRFADGAFEGVDVWYEVQRAMAAFGKGANPQGGSAGRTRFADLGGTAVINNGVLRNDDLSASMPFMQANGAGSVNFPTSALEYRLDVKFLSTPDMPANANELAGKTVPLIVGGTIASPKLDWGNIVKALAEQRVKEEVDKAKDRLLDRLGDRIGIPGLGGGNSGDDAADADGAEPAEGEVPAEEEEISPEDELKNKLKDLFGGD